MHLPNEFIDPKIALGFFGVAVTFIGLALNKIKDLVSFKIVKPIAQGVSGVIENFNSFISFGNDYVLKFIYLTMIIFAAQAFNIPVLHGTSGHLLGGVLSAIFLGPFGAILSISVVLIIQAVFFGDGGILVLGVNIFNMAILGGFLGWYIYKFIYNNLLKNYYVSMFLSSFITVLMAATFCSLEINLSHTLNFKLFLLSMLKIHFFIGVLEGILTILFFKILVKKFSLYNI